MRIIFNDGALISKIQVKTGCNFVTACEIVESIASITEIRAYEIGKEDGQKYVMDRIQEMKNELNESVNAVMEVALKSKDVQAIRDTSFVQNGILVARGIVDTYFED